MSILARAPCAHTAAAAAAAACLAICSTAGLAQGTADADQIVVTAARTAQSLTDALPHTTVISRTDIERSQALDLAALLAREAGVQLATNGGRGSATTLFMRGAPTRQVLVLVDGVALSRQDATGQMGIEHLMLDAVDRVEIVRGNVSALYGSGAVGGVVQVFTRAAGDRPQASLQIEAGSRGLVQTAVQGSGQSLGRWGATRIAFGASVERERGASALDPAQIVAANPDRDGYRNTSANLALTQDWADGHRLALTAWHSDGRLDYDSEFATPIDTQRSRTRQTLLRLSSQDRLSAAWISRLSWDRQTDDARYVESGDYGYSGRYRTVTDSLRWGHEIALSGATRLTGGLEQQRQRIDADDGYGGLYAPSRRLTAAYLGGQTRWGDHDLALNLRRDDFSGQAARHTGRLGWGWHLDTEWTLVASAANAFGMPPLGYLYAPYYGNPALQPERSNSVEIGLQWAAPRQRLRATAFRTRVRNEFDYDYATQAFANLARTRNSGLEVSYSGRAADIDWQASLTSQSPRDASTGEPRLRRSRVLANLSASREWSGGWRTGIAARHVGARSDSGARTLAAYTVVDLTAQWDIQRAWQVFGRIENLGDVRYQTAYGYNQPARGVFVGLKHQLPL